MSSLFIVQERTICNIYKENKDMIYDMTTLFSVGKNNYNFCLHRYQLLQYLSVYIIQTANQNRLKPLKTVRFSKTDIFFKKRNQISKSYNSRIKMIQIFVLTWLKREIFSLQNTLGDMGLHCLGFWCHVVVKGLNQEMYI